MDQLTDCGRFWYFVPKPLSFSTGVELRLRELVISSSNNSIRAIISSTARDLPEHRREVMAACLSHDVMPKMMEHLPASDEACCEHLFLLSDQFEEVWSQCDDAEEGEAFIDALLDAAWLDAGPVAVIITLRSDFLAQSQRHPRLNALLAEQSLLVAALSAEGLRAAIAQPAERAGYPLDEVTIARMLEETLGREAVLPLLQFALSRIWEGMAMGVEPRETLRKLGGVGGALASEAQAVYSDLDEDDKAIARRAFTGMVQLGEGAEDTRRPALLPVWRRNKPTGIRGATSVSLSGLPAGLTAIICAMVTPEGWQDRARSFMFKTIHSHQHHLGWNTENTPVLQVAPGESVEFSLLDASGNRISEQDDASIIETLAPENANPLTGPVYIENAEPGDTLMVEILEFSHSDWGWTAIIPGFGLLADQFTEPYLHISEYDSSTIRFTSDIALPTRPFAGTIGVCPNLEGTQSAIPPHRCGGNMDNRDLVAGAKLFFPVDVPGALFSVGDGHAAQGDGEVCGTAVETRLGIQVKFSLLKGQTINAPKARVPGRGEPGASLMTMGISADLMTAARDAVQFMIDELGRNYGISPEIAYCLVSCAGNLQIAELVNAPNWTVACSLPESCFI